MPINRTPKMLFQRNIATTGADSVLYQPPSSTTKTFVKAIWIVNTGVADTTFSLYVNQGGVIGGDSVALYVTAPIKAKGTQVIQTYSEECLILHNSSAALIGRAGASGVITMTGFGVEVEET